MSFTNDLKKLITVDFITIFDAVCHDYLNVPISFQNQSLMCITVLINYSSGKTGYTLPVGVADIPQ